MHTNQLPVQAVVDRKGKPLGEASMVGIGDKMYSGVYKERINVREQAV
jgi:hypothetical protein